MTTRLDKLRCGHAQWYKNKLRDFQFSFFVISERWLLVLEEGRGALCDADSLSCEASLFYIPGVLKGSHRALHFCQLVVEMDGPQSLASSKDNVVTEGSQPPRSNGMSEKSLIVHISWYTFRVCVQRCFTNLL